MISGPSPVNDPGEFKDIARGAPAAVTTRSILCIRADLCGFGHQKIQFSLRQVIELLQFQLPVQQMAAKPFAGLLLGGDVSAQSALQR